MADFTIKRNDRLPAITAVLSDAGGVVDLSAPAPTGVRFVMMLDGAATPLINAAAVIEDADAGLVSYTWQDGDTDAAGNYLAEWQVTYEDGLRATFPNDRPLSIVIVPDLAAPEEED